MLPQVTLWERKMNTVFVLGQSLLTSYVINEILYIGSDNLIIMFLEG